MNYASRFVISIILILSIFLFFPYVAQSQFIENKGQIMDVAGNFHPEVKFSISQGNDNMYFQNDRVVCAFSKADVFDLAPYQGKQHTIDSIKGTLGKTIQRIDIAFLDANPDVEIIAGKQCAGTTNFFLNKREHILNVGSFETITYKNIYPGIDIVFYQQKTGMKYDIILHQGADLSKVKIKYEGAESVKVIDEELCISTKFHEIKEAIPMAYYDGDANKKASVSYNVQNNIIEFKSAQEEFKLLTIDPVVTWMTYFQTTTDSGSMDYDHNIADSLGNLFIQARCDNNANDYPLVNPGGSAYVQSANTNDVYIAKFDPNRALVWATYFGGTGGMEWSLGTEVMAIKGNTLHIVGDELSTDAPFLNGGGFYYNAAALRPYYVRFNTTTGQLLHCTNIGGHTSSHPSIAVSRTGQVAIIFSSYNWATVHIVNRAGAYNQAVNGGFTDLFLMLLNSSYTQTWGTWLGGPGTQENGHVSFDANDNIFFVSEVQWLSGSTIATEHLVNPGSAYYQTATSGEDIMIGKFTPAGALNWNTLYGGNGNDGTDDEMGNGTKVIISPLNELIVLGSTSSTDFPLQTLAGAYNQTLPANVNAGGSYDDFASFILKFSNAGVRQWATYWGENSVTSWSLLYDGKFTTCDKFVVAARASYTPMPVAGYYNKPTGGQSFLMQFNGNYAAEWSSYVGNSTGVPQISFTPFGNRLYLTTNTNSITETTVNPGGGAYYDAVFAGPHYAAYTIWEFNIIPTPVLIDTNICAGSSVTLTAGGGIGTIYDWYTTSSGGTAFFTGPTYTTPILGSDVTYWVTSSNGSCISERTAVTVHVNASPTVTANATPTTICQGQSSVLNGGGAVSYSWNNGLGAGVSHSVMPSATTTYTVTGTDSGCSNTASITITVNTNSTAPTSISASNNPICLSDSTSLTVVGGSLGTGASWQWFSGTCSGTPEGNGSSITVDPTGSTTYYVLAQGSCNTTLCASLLITVTAVADATILSTAQVCISQSAFTLSATDAGGVWSGTGITNTATGLFDPATAGIGSFQIIYTISGSCGDADTIMLDVVNTVDATITPTSPICISDAAATLSAANPGGTWTGTGITNGATGLFDPSVAGIGNHVIIYTISGSCGSADTITLSVVSTVDASINAAGPYCQNIPTITLSAATNGGIWTGTGITSAAMGTFDPSVAGVGIHDIIYTISGACGNADTIQLTVNAVPSSSTTAVAESCIGKFDGTASVTPSGGASPYTYLWSNAATGASVTGLAPDVYTVIVTDANNCFTLDTAIIFASSTECETVVPVIYIPNIFTPNGDGNNDVFYVRGQGITTFTLSIYDRWGEMVFETSDLAMGWDGTFHGKDMDAAVFVWYVHAEFNDGTVKDDKGNLTMTR